MEAVQSSKMMNIWPLHRTEIQRRQSFHQCTYFDPAFHIELALLSLYKLNHCTRYIYATCIDTVHNQTYSQAHAVMYSLWQYDEHPNSHSSSWQMSDSKKPHICNDKLLIRMGLVHVWNRGLLISLLLSDNTIVGAQLKSCLPYQIKS
jgi:hypothetical protein